MRLHNVHTLDARLARWMLPIRGILIASHDTISQDLLDKVERATGGNPPPRAPVPRLLRAADAVEHRAIVLRRDPLAWIVPGALVSIAAVHAAWALGWRWPGGSDQALADRVVGTGNELPADWLTALVAGALVAGAAIVRAGANGASGRVRLAAWAVAGVLLVRGAVMLPIDLVVGLDDLYSRLDLAIYSPLCLALGAGTGKLLRSATASPSTARP